jgi:hypothetical protein
MRPGLSLIVTSKEIRFWSDITPMTLQRSVSKPMGRRALQFAAPIVVALLSPIALMPFPPKYYFVVALAAFPVVLVFTAVVAFPLYLLVPEQLRSNGLVMSGYAFLAGATSYMFLQFLLQPESSRIGDIVYVQEGAFTHDGWLRALTAAAIGGLIAIPGGLLWSAAQRRVPNQSLECARDG